jgi:hypothetical protein
LRERKPQAYRFKDDGLIPNHPKWPLVIYKSAVRLPEALDPAAVFEDLFESNGWGDSWRDGIYDYPDGVLARFDFIVASVHGQFKMDRAAQTQRIIRAVSNPYTTILGHMTGRQLLRRPGYDIDIEKVLAACAEHSVAVEINANPWRLDLDWRWHETALRLGCMMSINPDAHSTRKIDLTRWGVEMARKGGVPKERVLNCLNKEFAKCLANRRDQRRGKRLAPGRRVSRRRTVTAKAKKASPAGRKKRIVAS